VPSFSRVRQLTGEDDGAAILQNTGKYPVTLCYTTEDSNLRPA
jgi:hypothetical protein